MKMQKVNARSYSCGGTRALASVKYIVIHYTGNRNDTAIANANYFAKMNTRAAGAHFFVDQAGNIVRSIDMKRIAWSVGGLYTTKNGAGSYYKKCTNANSVSIELCDIADQEPSTAQIKATKELVTYIKKQCANAQTIIRHWDVNGKLCPARMAGKGNSKWSAFKKAISGSSAAATMKTTANLNMRTGAGTKYKIILTIPKGKKVTLIKKGSSWHKVAYSGKTGYCSAKYLS